jgi:transposase
MIAPTHQIEHIGGIPYIFETLKELQIIRILNEVYSPHRNWVGLPIGETIAIWICYCLTENDHRMCSLEKWVTTKKNLLEKLIGFQFSPKCFTDDHLARILSLLHNNELWNRFESELNRSTLRIYGLTDENIVRLDMTTVNSNGIIDKNGLIQFGNSKDDASLPQIKIVLSVLDVLGLPLTVSVVPGNCADDPLYIPAMEKVKKSTGQSGLLFVGDCKMGAIATRLYTTINNDFYLCPLSEVSHPTQEIYSAIIAHQESNLSFTQVSRSYYDGSDAIIAEGFEKKISHSMEYEGKIITWEERLIYAKSFAHANKFRLSLEEQVKKAFFEINSMNKRGKGKKIYRTIEEAKEKVHAILGDKGLTAVFEVEYIEHISNTPKRKYGNNPARIEQSTRIEVKPTINLQALQQAQELSGWRVYVTNKPENELSMQDVVLTYRDQYIIEHQFHRLKGKALSLAPMFIQRDDRIDGLVKFLTIVMRPLVIIEKKVRDSLKSRGQGLSGLFEYNPTKIVNNPKTERIIEFFKEIYLLVSFYGEQVFYTITGINQKHREILNLMNVDISVYTQLGSIQESEFKISER